MATTQLSLTATPGKRYSFLAKTAAAVEVVVTPSWVDVAPETLQAWSGVSAGASQSWTDVDPEESQRWVDIN